MQKRNTRQAVPEQALVETTSLCTTRRDTGIESCSPLVNCFVYYTLLEASPHTRQPLRRICHVLYWCLVDPFLHHSQMRQSTRLMYGWPHVRSSEFGSPTTKQIWLPWTSRLSSIIYVTYPWKQEPSQSSSNNLVFCHSWRSPTRTQINSSYHGLRIRDFRV